MKNYTRLKKILISIFILASFCSPAASQITSFNFRHLTNSEGLSDGIVRALVQDKYGFIWIGTTYGLNRFDGITVKNYFSSPRDSGSISSHYILSLYCDSKSRLWVGTHHGISLFNYAANRFINYRSPKKVAINDIREDKTGRIWLATEDGLWIVDQLDLSIRKFELANDPEFSKKFGCPVRQLISSPGGDWYLATNCGIKMFNPLTYTYDEIKEDTSKKISLSGNYIMSAALDSTGFLWVASLYPRVMLHKIDLKNRAIKYYDRFTGADKKWGGNAISRILVDRKGRVWFTASISGLSLYDDKKDDFKDYKADLFIPNSLLTNHNMITYQDNEGIIWLGSAGSGVSYFNPDKNLFHNIYPLMAMNDALPDIWCRAACEDRESNLWLATGRGLVKYDKQMQLLTTISNIDGKKPVIHYNSVRSLLEDDEGDIWIGTAKGLNRYHTVTGTIDFFDKKQGIPLSFFWMMAKDKNGGVWLGSTHGLYKYIRGKNQFDDLSRDSLFSKYAHRNIQALFADSRNRLWIGILDVGLVMYDLDQKKIRLLTVKDSLVSDTRFSSFAEDKEGLIWFGSEDGLTVYNPEKNISCIYKKEDGLPSSRTNNIMVDSFNRIWIGTSNSLCMLDASRDKIKKFDVNDGLLTNQFNEQAAYRTKEGLFIYPTYKGFLAFRPEDYQENVSTVPVYITSFKIADKKIIPNTENLQNINLRYNENFFNLELAGLNYLNPYKCMYAYKLDPFDKDWIYTSRREINYTNIPAGDYTFRYKVITDNPDWNVPEKTVEISINSVFYKTWWFQSFMILLILTGILAFFRYRIRQREEILILQAKSQLLEKEKAMVMYESLKQQLNPHFLFNSLSSLSSLIQSDQKTAKEFLDQMSKIYRYILKSRDSELVPLIEDLKLVQVYIQLQQTRFQNGLIVDIRVDEEYYHRKIVPVTLQNLIENAIKHNVIDTDTPLVIDVFIENDFIIVRNNLQKKNFVETSNRQGLANMQSLYRYLSGKSVEINEDKNYFTVKIPLI